MKSIDKVRNIEKFESSIRGFLYRCKNRNIKPMEIEVNEKTYNLIRDCKSSYFSIVSGFNHRLNLEIADESYGAVTVYLNINLALDVDYKMRGYYEEVF